MEDKFLIFWVLFTLLSSNVLNLDKKIFLSTGKGLTLYLIFQFWTLPIQQQIKIWCHKYWQMRIQFSDRVKNIVGKEEIARYEQFLFFPQCFQKLSAVDGWNEYLWYKGLRVHKRLTSNIRAVNKFKASTTDINHQAIKNKYDHLKLKKISLYKTTVK